MRKRTNLFIPSVGISLHLHCTDGLGIKSRDEGMAVLAWSKDVERQQSDKEAGKRRVWLGDDA